METSQSRAGKTGSGRLSKAERWQQLLDVSLIMVREEGADNLTLARLAARAGVSKPIAYEHFGTRHGLLAELYKSLDRRQVAALRKALDSVRQHLVDTAEVLATAYIHCAVDTSGEIYAVGAALTGSDEMSAVHQQALAGYVQLFATALEPHSPLPPDELQRRCVGLVGAGEALCLMLVGGQCTEWEAAVTFSALLRGGVGAVD